MFAALLRRAGGKRRPAYSITLPAIASILSGIARSNIERGSQTAETCSWRRPRDLYAVLGPREKCERGVQQAGSSSEGRHLKLKSVRKIKGSLYAARDCGQACQSVGNTQEFVPVQNSFGVSRLCLFSLLELLFSSEPWSSPSQSLFRLFPVQLLYPRSQNCCVAQKA